MKNAIDLDLGAAVKRVASGEFLFSEHIATGAHREKGKTVKLSARELEILQLIVEGMSNKEIGVRLELSVNTVGTHRANIMRQLGIHKSAELIVYAIQKGLVQVR